MKSGMQYLGVVLAVWLMMAVPVAWGQEGAEEAQPSLYERLGGLAPITVVVSDFIDVLVQDPELNANPAVDAARQRVPAPYLKYRVTSFVCQATGGACQYQGHSMYDAHAHLGITESEWGRMMSLLEEVLREHEVPPGEIEDVLALVESTKGEIVTAEDDA
ncbi:group 1 truncated hemoglobin [Halomonas organivorans]